MRSSSSFHKCSVLGWQALPPETPDLALKVSLHRPGKAAVQSGTQIAGLPLNPHCCGNMSRIFKELGLPL